MLDVRLPESIINFQLFFKKNVLLIHYKRKMTDSPFSQNMFLNNGVKKHDYHTFYNGGFCQAEGKAKTYFISLNKFSNYAKLLAFFTTFFLWLIEYQLQGNLIEKQDYLQIAYFYIPVLLSYISS